MSISWKDPPLSWGNRMLWKDKSWALYEDRPCFKCHLWAIVVQLLNFSEPRFSFDHEGSSETVNHLAHNRRFVNSCSYSDYYLGQCWELSFEIPQLNSWGEMCEKNKIQQDECVCLWLWDGGATLKAVFIRRLRGQSCFMNWLKRIVFPGGSDPSWETWGGRIPN